MGLAPLLQEPKLNESQRAIVHRFLEETGYGFSDLLSLNYGSQTFLTRNGGKYRIVDGKVEHLSGPSTQVEDRFEL